MDIKFIFVSVDFCGFYSALTFLARGGMKSGTEMEDLL